MSEILDWIHQQGYSPVEKIIIDGQVHRFTHIGHKRDNIGYCFYEHGGWMHDHTIGKTFNWNPNRVLADPVAQKKIRQQQEKIKKELETQKKEAIKEAVKLWEEGVEPTNHPYLERKNIKPYGIKQKGNLLLIPVQNGSGLSSLQTIDDEGDKLFLRGGEVKGRYHLLANDGENLSTIIICEGYATAASIREATGYPVVAAFFASNLPPVAKHFKKEYPESRIIIAADNDKHNEVNAGVQYANKCDGCEVRPVQFDEGTDYNDLAAAAGLPAVYEQIFPLPVPVESRFNDEESSYSLTIIRQPFRVLGCNNGIYYYYPETTKQIVELQAANHTAANLLRIARLTYWEDKYGVEKKGEDRKKVDYTFVADELMHEAHSKGIFRPEEQIRARGVWMDGRDVVFNSGELLYIGGFKPLALSDYNSENIYVRAKALPAPLKGCTNAQAFRFRQICEMGTWKNPVAGMLLAGWCVVSMACGCLPWRPHIWITGASGSGKTTMLKDIIGRVLKDIMITMDGNTTEAAIRQTIGDDSRPIIYDEAEGESIKQQAIMEGVMELVRKASSGAAVIKGAPNGDPITYYCKSTFCFASINPPIKHYADETRISLLELRKPRPDEDGVAFNMAIEETLTPDFGRMLLGRVVENLPTLLTNCKIFIRACAAVLKDRRAADQIGVMLAGTYLLHSTNIISYEAALDFIKRHDVRSFTAVDELTDSQRLLATLSAIKVRTEGGVPHYEYTVGNLIHEWYFVGEKTVPKETIENALRPLGIWPRKSGVWIANNSAPLAAILKNTQWIKWQRSLSDLEGAETVEAARYWPGTASTRGVQVPSDYFIKQEGELK